MPDGRAGASASARDGTRPHPGLPCLPGGRGGVCTGLGITVGAMERLKRRRDFLAAATGVGVSTPGFVVQERRRSDAGPARVGFTVSRKVGGAVERNRLRRQLREVVRLSATTGLNAGSDYVLIGRRAALEIPFVKMTADFVGALRRLEKRRTGIPGVAGKAPSASSRARREAEEGDRRTSITDQSRS
jgi:ribonuclease P protein component